MYPDKQTYKVHNLTATSNTDLCMDKIADQILHIERIKTFVNYFNE